MDPQFISPQITLTNLLVGSPPLHDTSSVRNLDQDDVYRGLDPRTPANAQPSTSLSFNPMATQASISSSSSSSSSSGMRFNVIPSIIERAISRWARGRGLRRRGSFSSETSASGTSSSSCSASASSNHTTRRKKSPVSIRSHTTSITTRRQARAMSRALPREFTLLLPPHLTISSRYGAARAGGYIGPSKRELKTASLQLMLAQLGLALKRNAKTQRQSIVPTEPAEEARREPIGLPTIQLPECRPKNRDNGSRVAFEVDSDPATPRANEEPRKDKGKLKEIPRQLKEVPRQFFLQESKSAVPSVEKKDTQQSCWWLDVASPTWDDMKSLGKLLQLHPLTLEDILQRESREKFEHFPRLGYYFIVFRAVDRPDPVQREDDETSFIQGLPELTEVLETTNIYLVVFKEGICVFHFEDISRHMDALKRKVLRLEGTIPLGSDWIAHGLMDSVVDAFFPILRDIEKEVSMVEDFVSGIELNEQIKEVTNPFDALRPSVKIAVSGGTKKTLEISLSDEKAEMIDSSSITTELPKKGLQFKHYIRLLHQFPDLWKKLRCKKKSESILTRDQRRLRRMTATRRLVNSLKQLLSSKAQIIGQIRKRLHGQGDVAIYLGDVQDHIISLHQSLGHYDQMLSHSHPAYQDHLRLRLHGTKCGIDITIVPLSVVTVLDLAFQVIVGFMSMNVHLPASVDFSYFGIVLGVGMLVCIVLIGLIIHWCMNAHRRRGMYRQW